MKNKINRRGLEGEILTVLLLIPLILSLISFLLIQINDKGSSVLSNTFNENKSLTHTLDFECEFNGNIIEILDFKKVNIFNTLYPQNFVLITNWDSSFKISKPKNINFEPFYDNKTSDTGIIFNDSFREDNIFSDRHEQAIGLLFANDSCFNIIVCFTNRQPNSIKYNILGECSTNVEDNILNETGDFIFLGSNDADYSI